MVPEAALETILMVVLAVGAPLVVAIFYTEGLIVGKLLQPSAVFVAYVAVTTPDLPFLLIVCVLCIIAGTLGQWTLYRGFNEEAPEFVGLRRRVPFLRRLPGRVQRRVGQRRLRFVERVVGRYGAIGIFLLNIVPGIRGLTSIPAGISEYPRGRFVLASTAGNIVYTALLVAVAFGVLELAGLYG